MQIGFISLGNMGAHRSSPTGGEGGTPVRALSATGVGIRQSWARSYPTS